MELMLTVPVGDCIVFQQICPITLMTCKSVTAKRLCCICNIYYYLLLFMKNEDTTGVVKPTIKGYNGKKKTDKETLWTTKQYTYNQRSGVNPVPAPLMAPVMLFLLQTRWYVINEERTGTYLQTLLVLLRISIFRIFFTQPLTLKRIPRTSDASDNPLTSCSIPYTDLRAIIMNWILKRWQDSWDQQINNKLLVMHSFVGKILCSRG